MLQARELKGMHNSYQVQNQINSGKRELEKKIYISLDNKDGMSQELSWGLMEWTRASSEPELYMNHTQWP